MSGSPDDSWVIRDLDMYPPHEPTPAYTPVKMETSGDGYHVSPPGCVPQSSAGPVQYPYNVQYSSAGGPHPGGYPAAAQQSGEWPSDLDNILLDSNLPTDCDSPLKLEDYNMSFVYVDPSTLDQNNVNNNNPRSYPNSTPACSPHNRYPSPSVPSQAMKPSVNCYDGAPYATDATEMTPAPCIPGIDGQSRMMGSRGRPRNEWRITNLKPKKVGRPRIKTGRVGRPPKEPVIKKEVLDDEFCDLSFPDDMSEEKRERRREQNRRAARKLREKKKFHVEKMKQDYEGIIQDNCRLTSEVRELKMLVQQLTAARDGHVCSCRDVTPSPASTTSSSANYVSSMSGDCDVMTPSYNALSHISPDLGQMER